MRVIVDNSGEYNDVMGDYYNLCKYDNGVDDVVLFQGYNTSRDVSLKRRYHKIQKRIYINLESPCSMLTTDSSVREQSYFTHIYTIDPYTAEWLGNTSIHFELMPFPISFNALEGISNEKEFDVIYMGTLMNRDYYGIIDVIRKFNYVFTSLRMYNGPYKPTHLKVKSKRKWALLAKSMMNVVINQAPFVPRHVTNVKSYPNWEKHGAFTRVGDGVMPQIKVRVTEAMALKTLNLVKRDEWNVIERWFKPNTHFLYWDNNDDLKDKIELIRCNYNSYQHIIDAAYDEVRQYDIDYIFKNRILNDN